MAEVKAKPTTEYTTTGRAYNRIMYRPLFDEMKAYVGFDARDEANLAALADAVVPLLPQVVQRFYEELQKHPRAREVFSGGNDQIERQKRLLDEWLLELFTGVYDDHYFKRRGRIGTAHVRVGVPQRYMLLGMELVWQELSRGLKAGASGNIEEKLRSLHKLLTLDLTIMLDSYQKSHTDQTRRFERAVMEEKLTRAEHLAEIGQLAASLAHEIKNPLAGISGAIQIIGDSLKEGDPHRPIVTDILGQIARLDATVKDLLLYARPTPPEFRRIVLDKMISRVLSLLRGEPALLRVRVEQDGSVAQTTIYADEGQIEQLLINLILNAAQASSDGAVIRIAARADEYRTRLFITDFGTGMTSDVCSRAVEPFFTTKAQGTGLGLAICRRIVEAHGGTISLQSTVGKGTTVTVDLPFGSEDDSSQE